MTTATKRKAPAPSKEAVAQYLGKTFYLPVGDDLNVSVRVLEVRNRFGHVDVAVTPLTGEGEAWVQASRLSKFASN